jgi:hypothetical protein
MSNQRRLAVREALKVKLADDYDRIYLYPEENDLIPKEPKTDFVILAEIPASEELTLMDASSSFMDLWSLGIYVYCSYGEHPVPSDPDAEAKTRSMAAREVIQDTLLEDYTISGTVIDMGTDEAVFSSQITPLLWRATTPAFGVYFEVPVITQL